MTPMPDPSPPTPSRLDAALTHANVWRHAADELRRAASRLDSLADSVMQSMKDEGHG